MVQQSEMQGFTTNWNKRVAWAQSQGISRSSYYPIYQMDSARLLAGETPMSNAEATRAMLAAQNPNNVTPVPGDKPSPTNIWGNTVNDLRSIFTGLAPNHLVTNLFDTVKDAVTKPSTWLAPIEDLAQGDVKQGLEAAAGLNGQNSILSWLPGVYVAGEIAQGGVGEVLSHPVVSFLDVAPFAPAGRVIEAAADASRVAGIADRVGMTASEFRDASLPGMAKGWILNTNLEDTFFGDRFAQSSQLHELDTVDPKTGLPKPTSIGDALDRWITAHTGMGKTLSSLFKGALNINDTRTTYEQAVIAPAAAAMKALSPEQQEEVSALVSKSDPRAQGKSAPQIEFDDKIDPQVRKAYAAVERARQWVSDQALASGQAVAFTRLDGSIGISHTAGESTTVLDADKELRDSHEALLAKMDPLNKVTESIRMWDRQADRVRTKLGQDVTAASQRAEYLHERPHYMKVGDRSTFRGRVSPEMVPIDIAKQAQWLFGKVDPIKGEGGIMDSIESAMDERDYAQVKVLTGVGLRALSGHGVHAIDATIDPAFVEVRQDMVALHRYAIKRIDAETKFEKGMEGYGSVAGIRPELKRYLAAKRAFGKAVWDHPTAEWIDAVQNIFIRNLVNEMRKFGTMEDLSKELRDRGFAAEKITQLERDPVKMAQLLQMEVKRMAGAPDGVAIMTKRDMDDLYKSAIDEANKLREEGHELAWVPQISTTMLRGRDIETGLYGVHISTKGRVRTTRAAHERKIGDQPTRYDVLASVHLATKEALQRDGTIEYADHILSPHLVSVDDAERALDQMPEFQDEILAYKTTHQNARDVYASIMKNNFKMVPFDPTSVFGWTLPKWGNEMYIPEGIAKALDTQLTKGQFPMHGILDAPTKLFRTAILNLSPRYTAHVGLGGTFLLALHSSRHVLSAIPEAWNIMKDQGDVPRANFAGAAQRSIDPVEYKQVINDTPLGTASRSYHQNMGGAAARWLAEENIEKVQGIALAAAKPLHWLKAVGDMNIKATTYMAQFQRAISYQDYLEHGLRTGKFKDPITGEVTEMTMARARKEAEENMLHVMGDQRAMTPLERGVFNNIFPFYGWTKHILKFVMAYPSDHPFRTQMLSVMAEQNTNDVASGLPKRIQFLMFLGSPDAEGNVTAIDVRSMDPLRDVANYATLSGFLSSLNPVLSAPLAVVDPSIIFGGNSLYPTVTYDSFYGIETAGSQGNALTALAQIIPQTTAAQALVDGLTKAGQYRNEAVTNPNGFAKTIFESLNIPFAQVQHLNVKQIAAQTELDRYHVATSAATNAFQTGDFSSISSLSSVPDPQNLDYEVSPEYLSNLYNSLLQQYPGQAPVETAPPPPPAPI